ncbi:MAG: YdeI/OmpD-associated family protein [Chloroflexi bacterium]|nr:YdeI/OmpD-associated family protein [Chloroflexota bacterium]
MITQKGIAVPGDLSQALLADARSLAIFEAMRPSCQRRYVNWVEQARRQGTRERRILKAHEMILDYGRRHPGRRAPV